MPFRLALDWEPIVMIEVSGELSDGELLAMTEEVTLTLRIQKNNNVRAAVVLDFSEAGAIAPSQRRMIGEWRQRVRDLTRDVCVGMAMVVRSPLIRGFLTAIAWFSPEPVPVVFVHSVEAGVAWAIRSCETAGVVVPLRIQRALKARAGTRLRFVCHDGYAPPSPGGARTNGVAARAREPRSRD